MHNTPHRPFRLEMLEDRSCPSVSVQYTGSSLLLTGAPNNALSITRVAGGSLALHVTDGAANLGTFNVTGDLRLNLTRYNANIDINFNDPGGNGTLGGNLVLALGQGNRSTIAGVNSITIEGGTVGGSVTFSGGSGNESLFLGNADAAAGTAATLVVGGNVNATLNHGSGIGSTFQLHGGSAIGGNLSTNGVDFVTDGGFGVNGPARVGGNVQVSDAGATAQPLNYDLSPGSTVGGSVALTGNNANGPLLAGNLAEFDLGSTVGQNVIVNFGNALNNTIFDGTVNGTASINGGNSSAVAGVPGNLVSVSGTLGALNLHLGNAGSAGATFGNEFAFAPSGVVLGNVNITMGNGSNTLDGDSFGLTGFQGTVFGNVAINLGNGPNKFTFVGSASGSTVSYTGGTGSNSVTLDTANPANPNTFAFNVNLGTGATNSVTFTAAATAGSAYLNFGEPGPNNTFNDLVAIAFPTTIVNL